MTEVQALLSDIGRVGELVAAYEKRTRADDGDIAASLALVSYRRHQAQLEERLRDLLGEKHADYVGYKISRARGASVPARAVAESLLKFQDLVTAAFDAFRSGPKKRYRPSVENSELSQLDFAVALPGSVDVSMTIDNERRMLIESDFDVVFRELLGLLGDEREEAVLDASKKLGIATISKLHDWADVGAKYEIETELKWSKDAFSFEKQIVSADRASRIRDLIERTVDEKTELIELRVTLEGFDRLDGTFHVTTAGDEEFKGKLSEDFRSVGDLKIPGQYTASLSVTRSIKYATGEETERWLLLSLFDQSV